MVGYFNALNKQDYNSMRNYLYPTDNEQYLLDILLKNKAVGITSIRLQTIYPAIVDGNVAIVGFETSTNAVFENKNTSTREINVFFFRKKNSDWYIAKPQDLSDIPAHKISDMIGQYKSIIKENMTETSVSNQVKYNIASYANLKKESQTEVTP